MSCVVQSVRSDLLCARNAAFCLMQGSGHCAPTNVLLHMKPSTPRSSCTQSHCKGKALCEAREHAPAYLTQAVHLPYRLGAQHAAHHKPETQQNKTHCRVKTLPPSACWNTPSSREGCFQSTSQSSPCR